MTGRESVDIKKRLGAVRIEDNKRRKTERIAGKIKGLVERGGEKGGGTLKTVHNQ